MVVVVIFQIHQTKVNYANVEGEREAYLCGGAPLVQLKVARRLTNDWSTIQIGTESLGNQM